MAADDMTPGERIRQIREKLGMTQEELAKAADLSKGFISDVENSKRNIGSQPLLRIATCLGTSVDYLLSGNTRPAKKEEEDSVAFPPELVVAAEQLELSFSHTVALLRTYNSAIARRAGSAQKPFTTEDWKGLYTAIKPYLEKK